MDTPNFLNEDAVTVEGAKRGVGAVVPFVSYSGEKKLEDNYLALTLLPPLPSQEEEESNSRMKKCHVRLTKVKVRLRHRRQLLLSRFSPPFFSAIFRRKKRERETHRIFFRTNCARGTGGERGKERGEDARRRSLPESQE